MVTLFDRFRPLENRKGALETAIDYFSYNGNTTVSKPWEVFSCCKKVFTYRRKFFYVVGRAPSFRYLTPGNVGQQKTFDTTTWKSNPCWTSLKPDHFCTRSSTELNLEDHRSPCPQTLGPEPTTLKHSMAKRGAVAGGQHQKPNVPNGWATGYRERVGNWKAMDQLVFKRIFKTQCFQPISTRWINWDIFTPKTSKQRKLGVWAAKNGAACFWKTITPRSRKINEKNHVPPTSAIMKCGTWCALIPVARAKSQSFTVLQHLKLGGWTDEPNQSHPWASAQGAGTEKHAAYWPRPISACRCAGLLSPFY